MASKIIILVLHIFKFSESLPARAQTLIRAGYWDSDDGFPVSDVNSALFTHLMCGFAGVNSTSYELSLLPSDEKQFSNFTDTVKIKNPSITTLLSIGAGNYPNYSTYSSMAGNPSSRKSFIDSSIKIARLYGFQGLDLSWYLANTSWDKYNIGILFKEWRAAVALEAKNNSSQSQLILTATVAYSPYSTAAAYPVDSIRQYLNWVHVFTTDYSVPTWTNFTGAHAALYDPNSVSNTEYGITKWIEEGLSADKLVLCLPFYGYAWTLVKPEDNGIGAAATGPALSEDGLVSYKEIKNHIKSYGPNVQVMYNSTYVVNYCSIGKIWFGFDDVEAIRVKVAYAKEKKLRGYHVWLVSYDQYWMLSQAAAQKDSITSASADKDEHSNNRRLSFALISTAAAALTLLLGCCAYKYNQMKRLKLIEGTEDSAKASNTRANNETEAGDFNRNVPNLRVYSLADIEAATEGFSIRNKLGEGGYGPVYKGVLPCGEVIAVKKLSKSSAQGFEEFKNEVMLTAKLQHVNLIRVLGQDMKPKISDFGMARIFTKESLEANTEQVVGTIGYISPEYAREGVYSTKSDVFSFGVLLLQIISGKRLSMLCGINENLSILEHAYELWKGGKGVEFVDSFLDDRNSPCKLMRCLEIALLCVQENPNDRPSMLEVSSMLKNETTNTNTPRKPAFSKQVDEIGIELLSTTQLEKCSACDLSFSEVVAR
ncbi:class V chitinase [Citrus sinensis]|nr:class V chitinase [Citrus sinensis]